MLGPTTADADRDASALTAELDGAGTLVVAKGAGRNHAAVRGGTGPTRVARLDRGSGGSPGTDTRKTDLLLGLAIVAVLTVALVLAALQDYSLSGGGGVPAVRARLQPAPPIETVLYDTRTLPIAPAQAVELNAQRPPDVTEVVAARPFALPGGALATQPGQTALECLAQAIYYEAASESEAGQRAVAQVVLNRVRSPAFPNTVCGVVFQGWTRVTGCQFSFTCDGSLSRAPSLAGMARARRLAQEALAGAVMRSVGNATHYHADYVVPYWAASLDKVQTVGRHVFYLIRGSLGRPAAFSSRYLAALERSPLSTLAGVASDQAGAAGLLPVEAPLGEEPLLDPLAADLAMGSLIAPAAPAMITAPARAPTSESAFGGQLGADRAGTIAAGEGGSLLADEQKGSLKNDGKPGTGETRSD